MITRETAEKRQRAELLRAIAGDRPTHIQMQTEGNDKYKTVNSPVSINAALAHLDGHITLGTSLWCNCTGCRAIAWDADNDVAYAILWRAAEKLMESTARPFLCPSPSRQHSGGGHLWLVFNTVVNAQAALTTAGRIAPELQKIEEYFPRGGRQVRLPAGLYCGEIDEYAVDRWCKLALFGPEVTYYTGHLALQEIAENMTPASWVTAPEETKPDIPQRPISARRPCLNRRPCDPQAVRLLPRAADDDVWNRENRHRQDALWFWITDHEAAYYFNARHDVCEMLPPEKNGYGDAFWRAERTPSVKHYPETNTWCDFGAGGMKNGKLDGGDALELHCRMTSKSRRKALRYAAWLCQDCAMNELEQAAMAGRGPAQWVAEIMSPRGWEVYDQKRRAFERQRAAQGDAPVDSLTEAA